MTFLQDGQSHDMLTVDEDGNSMKPIPEEPDEEDAAKPDQDLRKSRPLSPADASYDWSSMPEDVEVYIDVEPNLGNRNFFANRDTSSGRAGAFPADMQAFLRTDDNVDGKNFIPNLFDKVDFF